MVKVICRILFVMLLTASPLFGAIRMDLSRSTITTDDTVDLIFELEGSSAPGIPKMPLPQGLKVVGTMRQEREFNGKALGAQIRYSLRAEKAGTYTIGPFELKGQSGTEKIQGVTLEVTEPKVIESTEDIFVTLESSQSEMLVQETVELTLSIYTRLQIADLNMTGLPEHKFDLSKWQEIRAADTTIGNRRYRVMRFIAQLTPEQAGRLTLDPNFRLDVIESEDPYGMMFSTRSRRSLRLKLKEPLVLNVTHPPQEGRPDDFAGHLGNFRLSASISPKEVQVGDPVTLRVELSGNGSMQQALPPAVKENDDFKVYDPKLVTDNMQRDGLSGRKIREQVVIPKHAEVKEVPALTFSYYDTATKSYKTLQAGPFPLTVTESGTAPRTAAVSSLGGTKLISEPERLGDDLLYLKTRPGRIRSAVSLEPGWGFAGAATLPFALWALSGVMVRTRSARKANPSERRRSTASKTLQNRLKKMEKDGTKGYALIWEILSGYLGDRLNLPPGELNREDVRAGLQSRITGERLRELDFWMQKCEQARFAGGAAAPESALHGDFQAFVLQLDRELGK